MAARTASVLRYLRRLVVNQQGETASDAALLEQFVRARDEEAFAALVARHGPLVWRACRRVLADPQTAEDAFQATFLVFARRAAELRSPQRLVGWLYGVAYRVSLKARSAQARRQRREVVAPEVVAPDPRRDPLAEVSVREWLSLLDEEIQQLPEAYRLPVLLCCLEGHSQEEAARLLGWTPGSVRGRLERGRARLWQRLTRRGLSLPATLAGIGLGQAGAVPPAALLKTTVRQALAGAAGSGLSVRVATLAEASVLRLLSRQALRTLAVLTGFLGAVGVLVTLLPGPAPAPTAALQQDSKPQLAERPARTDRQGDPLPAGTLARLGTTRFRHVRAADLAFTADGKMLLTCGGDHAGKRTIRSWDAFTGRLLQEQPLPANLYLLALSPDGKLLAFNQGKDLLAIQERESGRFLHKLVLKEGSGRFIQAVFSPDNKVVVMGQRDGTLQAWNLATGKQSMLVKHESQPWGLCFAADGTLLSKATDAADGTNKTILRLLDPLAGREKASLVLRGGFHQAVLSPDGRTIALVHAIVGQSPQKVDFLDVATGKAPEGWIGSAVTNVASVQFAPDGKTVAISTSKETLLWDPLAGKAVQTFPGSHGERLTFSADGKSLAALRNWRSGTPDTTAALVWDVASGAPRAGADQGHLDEISGVALSPDGRIAASASGERYTNVGTVCLWEASTGKLLHALPMQRLLHRPLVFHGTDSKQLFVGTEFALLRLDTSTGQVISRYTFEGQDGMGFFHLTDDSQTLLGVQIMHAQQGGFAGGAGAPAAGARDQVTLTLPTWDVASGTRLLDRTVAVRGPGTEWALYSHLSPDGRFIAVPGGYVCATTTGRALGRLTVGEQGFGMASAFSPDGTLLAAAADHWQQTPGKKRVQVWEVATLLPVAQLETDEVAHVAFTADGRRLVTASMESLTLWDLATQQAILSRPAPDHFRGSYGPSFVSALAPGAAGRTLATGHLDTSILLWDLTAPVQRGAPLTAADRAACWTDLAGTDGRRALLATTRLIDAGGTTVQFLGDHLRPAQSGTAAATQLVQSPEECRQLRAIRVLEGIATPEARQVLKNLADGVHSARLTQSARAAVERLSRRPVGQ